MKLRTIITLMTIGATLLPLHARKVKGANGALTRPALTEAAAAVDTIVARAGALRLSGYDKTNAATRETFLATNGLGADSIVTEFEVELTYADELGRMLHKATHKVKCCIPPGETRALDVPAWDRNHAYHYHRSPAPLRRQSTPFQVKSKINYLIIK